MNRVPLRTDSPAEALLAAALRAEPAPWPADAQPALADRVLDACARHGIAALVHDRARRTPAWATWPPAVRDALEAHTFEAVAREAARREAIGAALGALAAAGVPALVMKGAALAYELYPAPWQRARADCDVLVRAGDRERAASALGALGHARLEAMPGALVHGQETWCGAPDAAGERIDLHWRTSNLQVLARALDFAELAREARPLPALAPAARALAPVHALLLACMHRAQHRHGPFYVDGVAHRGERLIWLYDVHLIAGGMDARARARFWRLARERGVEALCADAIGAAARTLGTRCPAPPARPGAAPELSARLLRAGGAVDLVTDLRALATWSQRWRLLREHALPPPAWMLRRYAVSSRLWLPALYVHRGVRGLGRKLLARRPG